MNKNGMNKICIHIPKVQKIKCDQLVESCVVKNKAGYTDTLVACGWGGAMLEKVIRVFGQESYVQQGRIHGHQLRTGGRG